MSDKAIARASALLEVGRGGEAVAILSTALAQSPGSYPLLCLLSRAHAQCDQHEWALYAARQAIAARPDGAEAFLLASEAFTSLGARSEAVRSAEQAVHLTPLSAAAHACLAMARASLRPPLPSALEVAQQAVRLAPQSANAQFAVGYCEQMLDRRTKAIAAYRRVLALQPDHAGALNNLGIIQARRGRLTKAAHDLRAAAAIDPKSETAHRNIDQLAWRFVQRLHLAVMLIYGAAWAASKWSLKGTTSRTTYGLIGGVGLIVLLTAALIADRRLPRPLRFYYRRLPFRDRQLGTRVALLLVALLLILALGLVPAGKTASDLLQCSWVCLIASMVLNLERGHRQGATNPTGSTGEPSDLAPIGGPRSVIGAAADARALAVARKRARRLRRSTMAVFVLCLCVVAATPCIALLYGAPLKMVAESAGGAAAFMVAPALFGVLLLLRSRRAALYLRGLEANCDSAGSLPVGSAGRSGRHR